jgi:hypothetical protein
MISLRYLVLYWNSQELCKASSGWLVYLALEPLELCKASSGWLNYLALEPLEL